MMEFEALHVTSLTEEVALGLEKSLRRLPGIEKLRINLQTHELQILFDESQLAFLTLTQILAQAGCPLRNMNAALLKDLSKK
jgi:hypothetical protein